MVHGHVGVVEIDPAEIALGLGKVMGVILNFSPEIKVRFQVFRILI